jgi:hypothetical protein
MHVPQEVFDLHLQREIPSDRSLFNVRLQFSDDGLSLCCAQFSQQENYVRSLVEATVKKPGDEERDYPLTFGEDFSRQVVMDNSNMWAAPARPVHTERTQLIKQRFQLFSLQVSVAHVALQE